jgi:hypothetical protein
MVGEDVGKIVEIVGFRSVVEGRLLGEGGGDVGGIEGLVNFDVKVIGVVERKEGVDEFIGHGGKARETAVTQKVGL